MFINMFVKFNLNVLVFCDLYWMIQPIILTEYLVYLSVSSNKIGPDSAQSVQ
jgi:hypothetical protein